MKNEVAQLSAKEILEREFKTAMRGYKPEEVDAFLDQIIKDYEAFNERIETLENELKKAQKSSEPQRRSSVQQTQPQTTAGGTTNFDILKRLSNLEKEVFGRKLYEDR
ncbi:cell division protein GpsB [Jeotgalibacillus alimentarius]|uniref:Cell division protein GpsB n=1 Tax=Jeotgalibacillus alimentarius TaxID=135826 RepID=A0A0C2S4C3_9BACL|nr:cell division regulator GpsB [Jeotgalibacillus alimentarius]KIL48889.1 cell division protein GpsB [Jeotgalibacillus alimentarius]